MIKFGYKEIPNCLIGKRHKWKGSTKRYGESDICIKCGYDRLEDNYRNIKEVS